MLPTPSTSHVNYDHIYEPAEDSYLLLDTLSLQSETAFLRSHFPATSPSPLVLEVGTGSGVVLAFATANAEHIFGCADVVTLGTDANRFACEATAKTVKLAVAEAEKDCKRAGRFLGCVNGDLATALKTHSVDVLIFNPPYVPTEALPDISSEPKSTAPASKDIFERDSQLLALSYAGGVDGMEITHRLLAQLPDVLSERGVAYVLVCAQNRPEEVKSRIRAWLGGWSAETVGSSGKKAGWEKLQILRIWRP